MYVSGMLIMIMSMGISIEGTSLPDTSVDLEALTQHIHELSTTAQKEVNLDSYIDNFKHILSHYVNEQYQLTEPDLEKVQVAMEGFLTKLAIDFKEVMNSNGKDWEVKRADDGLPDDKFEEVKKKVLEEFADIEEKTADELIYRLRKNLYETKIKLDEVVKDSGKVVNE